MQLEFDYWWFKETLPKLLCKDIINFAKSKNDLRFGIIEGIQGVNKKSKQLNKKQKERTFKTRNSNIVWLKEPWITDKVIPYIKSANKQAGWNFDFESCESMQFTIYKKGQYYNWHSDCGIKLDKDGQIRKLSASIILNDPSEFEGGELEFCHYTKPNEKIILSTEKQLTTAGSMAVFPSFMFHRVKPVTKGVRYSLVVWLRGFPLK